MVPRYAMENGSNTSWKQRASSYFQVSRYNMFPLHQLYHQSGIGSAANCTFSGEPTLVTKNQNSAILTIECKIIALSQNSKKTSTTNKENDPSNLNFKMRDSCKIVWEVQYKLDSRRKMKKEVLGSIRY